MDDSFLENITSLEIHSKKSSWRMFDRISSRYDFLNRLLSLRQDVYWRKRLIKEIPDSSIFRILDIGTGTADVIIEYNKQKPGQSHVIGLDPAFEMLSIGRTKLKKAKHSFIDLLGGDAHNLPFREATFDIVTIAFGIRNIDDIFQCLREIDRILSAQGTIFILEFSIPSNKFIKIFYLFYFRYVLPVIGALLSSDKNAYRYLNQTVEEFPYGRKFAEILIKSGFVVKTIKPLTFGIVTIYIASKRNKK